MLKIWPQVKVMTWPERSSCISVDPHRRPKHIYGVFIALAGLYQKIFPKNCWWPSMTWNDLGDMTRGHRTQYSDSGCKVYIQWWWWDGRAVTFASVDQRLSPLHPTRCLRVFSMVFVQKRRLSFFSHWLIMERSQNWPDIRSPISIFLDIHFIDTLACSNL